MTELYDSKVTIYNDIPKSDDDERHFDRFVLEHCNIQGGVLAKIDGTIENVVNAISVITRDVKAFKPLAEYMILSEEERKQYFTLNIGDMVVLEAVTDEVKTNADFGALVKKYANNGFVVRSISANIHGLFVDNISMSNVG